VKSKGYSEDLKRWHRGDLKAILRELQDGRQVYTHHFHYIDRYSLKDRTHLRKCLWSLVGEGLIENINLGYNIHQWKITEAGKTINIEQKS